jgi:hypothetical protein
MAYKVINKYIKRKVYMALLRPVVTCVCGIWTLSVRKVNNLLVFERKILLKVFGPVIVSKDGESEVINNCRR